MDIAERWALAQVKIDTGWPARQAFIETGLAPEVVDQVLADNATIGGLFEQNGDAGILL
jgi:hypothetical protein